MPVHTLVTQLRFSRREFLRVLDGLNAEDAVKRLLPMNCISWMVGHLAEQESRYWIYFPTGDSTYRYLTETVGFGRPASTPPPMEMLAAWKEVTAKADQYLDTLTPEILLTHFEVNGKPRPENVGTTLLRNIHHYWFHIGEAYAVRQMLGHKDLPVFVGDYNEYAWPA
jgi:hypothetical protein